MTIWLAVYFLQLEIETCGTPATHSLKGYRIVNAAARENLVPVTFKLPKEWKLVMAAICYERAHESPSETYREAVQAYIADYHRGKAA